MDPITILLIGGCVALCYGIVKVSNTLARRRREAVGYREGINSWPIPAQSMPWQHSVATSAVPAYALGTRTAPYIPEPKPSSRARDIATGAVIGALADEIIHRRSEPSPSYSSVADRSTEALSNNGDFGGGGSGGGFNSNTSDD